MPGRREFTAAGLSAAALLAMQGAGLAQNRDPLNRREPDRAPGGRGPGGPGGRPGPHHRMMDRCARACSDCARECQSCAAHCADELANGGRRHLRTLQSCLDCADLCNTAAAIVARGGPFAALICQACAEACNRCARACDMFRDDPHMIRCAKECRVCEAACKEMVTHLVPADGRRG